MVNLYFRDIPLIQIYPPAERKPVVFVLKIK